MTRIAVFGSGSWGTTFAQVLCDAGGDVRLWGRRAEIVEAINATRENPAHLPGRRLPESLYATTDVAEASEGAEIVVFAVPSQSFRENLTKWAAVLDPGAVLVSLMKGIELGSCKRMSEVIGEMTGAAADQVVIVSGPNLAKEIAARQPAATVVASSAAATAQRVQDACHTGYFRAYTGTDVVGAELCGATKNVIALAVGISIGMGFGDNTTSMLTTRGLAENVRLGVALGADIQTFAGLAGLGDLVATCGSPLSRNRTFGERLGRGESLAEVLADTREVAEGVKSCQSVLELATRSGVEMPITQTVVDVVHGDVDPPDAVRNLMGRSAKPEWYG
ncbi:MAG: NAD(P)H-dependent glycerol-3-phosphate dehydrogenase [Streptosporangiales bacterium]|nr:NAD(P)H-dependent glycerol-3-phosphate dehydrogenase [Streptosporangiales bacterium]